MRWQYLLVTFLAYISLGESELFELNIIHINDLHARVNPVSIFGNTCENRHMCEGGYRRLLTTVRKLTATTKNPLYLNAGNNVRGSLWYRIGGWKAVRELLDVELANAMTLGNQDLGDGLDILGEFLDAYRGLMVVANINAENEPRMMGRFTESVTLNLGNLQVGIVGAVCESLVDRSKIGGLVFRNASHAILEEAEALKDRGVDIIIALTHCGHELDKIIAQNTGSLVDIIVGGHAKHVLPSSKSQAPPYPTVMPVDDKRKVLIVQAGIYGQSVGHLKLKFDEQGDVIDYVGKLIYMDNTVAETPLTKDLSKVEEFIEKQGKMKIGVNKIELPKVPCYSQECALGNLYCDAMLYALRNVDNVLNGCLIPAEIMEATLNKGNITVKQLMTTFPFQYNLTALDLPGAQLRIVLENMVRAIDLDHGIKSSNLFPQVARFRIKFNLKRPPLKRIVELKAKCDKCRSVYESVQDKTNYRFLTLSYLVNSQQEEFSMLKHYASNVRTYDRDSSALIDYIKHHTPISSKINGRITISTTS
ncbi:apyrase [Stomoxys calcitrans]|uniref:apyrase n=1 Tax=Stomoxys calcitrans TaxID=35570 RepID=A0A1I8PSU7_STOCA|nr:apyrase [Stomoxys calcitrans]